MSKLWVKFQDYNATEVPSEGCLNVNQFLEACQKKLSPLLDTYAAAQLSLSTTRGGSFLRPGLSLLDIPFQSGYSANNDENPLFLFVVGGSSAQDVTFDSASKRRRISPPSVAWKPERDIVYSLEDEKLFFVNRDETVMGLQKIHRKNFARASNRSGSDWVIPIADNVFGLGKSEFSQHYIKKCRETWPDPDERNEFQKTLCACHTVTVTFNPGALLKSDRGLVLKKALIRALLPLFEHPPADLFDNDSETTFSEFLSDLAYEKSVGPLFIVFDEIGMAFIDKSLDDLQMRERFMEFCYYDLGCFFPLKNVFFVILGRASFLGNVGMRPDGNLNLSQSPFEFHRLSLHLIRKNYIVEILKNTFIDDKLTKTLSEHLELIDDKAVEEAANVLFEKTNGHPRSLLKALQKCHSLEDIQNYNISIRIEDEILFYQTLFRYKDKIQELANAIKDDVVFDLTAEYEDEGGKLVSYDYIASNSFISWESPKEEAKLYIHPFLKSKLAMLLYPFGDYVKSVAIARNISVDYPNVFEWMCLKRFQELFSHPEAPNKAAPEFFTKDMNVLGTLDSLKFSGITFPIPKITSNGKFDGSLTSSTAKPSDWGAILSILSAFGDICFKPRAKSASSDAFLVARTLFHGKPHILTVGLAVKNFSPATTFSKNNLERECEIFNLMFSDVVFKETDRLNVLVVCCTSYDQSLGSMIKGKASAKFKVDERKFNHIHEVILLNLSDKEFLVKFFNHIGSVEACLASVLAKDEKEFQESVISQNK